MSDLVTLIAPPGALGYPISFGTETYRPFMENPADPASRWLVKVAPEAVAGLTTRGGFQMLEQHVLDAIPPGFALVRHLTDPKASVGGGESDGNGNWLVPIERVADLASHGFQAVEGQVPQPPMTEDEKGKAVAGAAAKVMDLEQRLAAAAKFAESVVVERDGLKAKLDAAEAKIAELLAKIEAAAAPVERAVETVVEHVETAVEGAEKAVESVVEKAAE